LRLSVGGRASLGSRHQRELDLAGIFKNVAGVDVGQATMPAQVLGAMPPRGNA
jgi:hypothetical protein